MKKYCFGIDVGGTTVKMGYFDLQGNVLEKWEIVTRKEECGKYIMPDVAKSILAKIQEKGMDKSEIAGVGVGVPGPVTDEGIVIVAVNLGWENYPLNQTLSDLLGIPVKSGNDANVAALGEMWKGGGVGHDNLIAVTLGTGVGGGIIVDGKILNGACGAGGEIGHIHVCDEELESCGCKAKGCLEQYVSATGIVRMGKKKLTNNEKSTVLDMDTLSAKTIFDAVKDGDEVAVSIAEEFGECLGKALGVIATVVNPEIFVIGGGVSKAGQVILDYIEPHFKKYAFTSAKDTMFALATLGNDAGIYGAARMVLE